MPRKTLVELHAALKCRTVDGVERSEPDVLRFDCPVCTSGHGIRVSWRAPSLFEGGAGFVWTMTGTTLEDISLSPSINCDVPRVEEKEDGTEVSVPSPCKFHGWVRSGHVEW